jgi:hypothetical protein
MDHSVHVSKLDATQKNQLNISLALHFKYRENLRQAHQIASRIHSEISCKVRSILLEGALANLTHELLSNSNVPIITAHGTVLAYSFLTGVIRHFDVDSFKVRDSTLAPVFVHSYNQENILAVCFKGQIFYCRVDARNQVVLESQSSMEEVSGELVILKEEVGGLIFKVGRFYMCAEKDGRVNFNRLGASHWEFFKYSKS